MITIKSNEDNSSAALTVRLVDEGAGATAATGVEISQTFFKLYSPPVMAEPIIRLDSPNTMPKKIPALIDRLKQAEKIAGEMALLTTPEEMRAWARAKTGTD